MNYYLQTWNASSRQWEEVRSANSYVDIIISSDALRRRSSRMRLRLLSGAGTILWSDKI